MARERRPEGGGKTLVLQMQKIMHRIKQLESSLTDEEKKIKKEIVPGYGDNHRCCLASKEEKEVKYL